MTKDLRKTIANRSRLENQYFKNKSKESLRVYKKQKNFCSRLYKKERKRYYANLDLKKITNSKKFWKTAKPFFSDTGAVKTDVTLIEGNEIVQEDSEVAKILGLYTNVSDDPIDNIISIFSNHPSIKLIQLIT